MQRWLTNKDEETPVFFQVKDPDKGPLTSSYALNSEKNACIGVISVEHRRHRHRHRQRHGGIRNKEKNPNNGENDINGKKDKTGMDGRNGTNEYKSLCKFLFQSVDFVLYIFRTDFSECRAHDRGLKTEHLAGRSTHAFYSRCAPCSTVFICSRFIQCTCIGSRLDDSGQHVSRVLNKFALAPRSFFRLMSCRNFLGLPQRRSTFPENWRHRSGR